MRLNSGFARLGTDAKLHCTRLQSRNSAPSGEGHLPDSGYVNAWRQSITSAHQFLVGLKQIPAVRALLQGQLTFEAIQLEQAIVRMNTREQELVRGAAPAQTDIQLWRFMHETANELEHEVVLALPQLQGTPGWHQLQHRFTQAIRTHGPILKRELGLPSASYQES
jgi:hypothetical protein